MGKDGAMRLCIERSLRNLRARFAGPTEVNR
jgi:hypothetical protein